MIDLKLVAKLLVNELLSEMAVLENYCGIIAYQLEHESREFTFEYHKQVIEGLKFINEQLGMNIDISSVEEDFNLIVNDRLEIQF